MVAETVGGVQPLLRWMGSKRRDATLIAGLLPADARYREPFLGSGAVFLASGKWSGAVLGDTNAALMETYRQIRDNPTVVAAQIAEMSQGDIESTYECARARLHLLDHRTAATFIFVNTHCYNGIYRTNRQGVFNVPLGKRFKALPTAEEINDLSVRLADADLQTKNGIESVLAAQREDCIFIDPPYLADRPTYGEYGYHAYDKEADSALALATQKAMQQGTAVVVTVGQLTPAWKSACTEAAVFTRARATPIAGNSPRALDEFMLTNCVSPGDKLDGWTPSRN